MIERIHIEQLKVQANVGVPADERSQAQRLTMNITIWPRNTPLEDELDCTVNYSAVAQAVREIVSRRHYKLIETIAEEIAAELVKRFAIQRVTAEVCKFVLADADFVSVTAVCEPS